MSGNSLLPPIVPKEIPAHVIAAVGSAARIRNALERVALSAEVCRREQSRYWAARPPRPEHLLYRAKDAERDLDRALSELDAARADERQAKLPL